MSHDWLKKNPMCAGGGGKMETAVSTEMKQRHFIHVG